MIFNAKEIKKKLKRKSLSLEEKIAILDRLENGEKIAHVAKSTCLNESTIRTFQKNAETIRKTVANICPLGAKRVMRSRKDIMMRMEKALMMVHGRYRSVLKI
jgi:hypothetical protein